MKKIELVNKRKPREKHFLQEDGTIIANVYDFDIHYKKDGKYEEIDNTLVKENEFYCNKENNYKVFFNENFSDTLMSMKKDNYFLELKLENAKKTKLKKGKIFSKFKNNVSYDGVLDGLDIEYTTLPNKVKETIILHNNKFKKVVFTINTNLTLLEKGNLIDVNHKNKHIFRIEKPFMKDSKGEVNNNISYKLLKNNNEYRLELLLDEKWLKSASTLYPIYIDPTITNVGEDDSLYDTYIYQGDTNTEKHNEEFLKAGVERINNNNVINRTLIKFELPEIGTGSNIVSAWLQLVPYPTNTEYPTEKIASIHRVTANWDETNANWDNMHDKFDNYVENIYYMNRSTVSYNTITPGFISDGDITGLVKKWYREYPNYGVMIKSVNEEEYIDDDFPMFYSKENNVQGDYNPKPIFCLVYRNQNGIEQYLDYKIQSFSQGNAYINTYNGNLTSMFSIGSTIGGKFPINLGIVYNTNDVVLGNSSKFGIGYKLNFEQTLKEITIDSNNYLEYLDEDGTLHYLYKEDERNIYNDEEGLNLSVTMDNNCCIMTDGVGSELTFTKFVDKFYLTRIKDSNNNEIEVFLNDDNSINKLRDKFGSEISILYNDNNIIINSPSNITQLNYTNGLLTSISNEQGTTAFNYNDKKILISITDITGLKISYEYYDNSPYKVKKVAQYGLNEELGQYYSIEYGYDVTRITDNRGKVETIMYNYTGNVESRNSMKSNEDIEDAYSIVQNVGDSNPGEKNKIISSVIPVKFIKNHLKNTSFEQDIDNFICDDNLSKEFTTEEYNSGYRSLKVTSTAERQSIEQSINIEKGKFYTFSGYFKNSNLSSIALSYLDSDGNEVLSSKNLENSDNFERDDITIYYDENASGDLKITITLVEIGTIYVDDLQLEEGEVANGYNVIENSDFSEGYNDWTISGWTFDGSTIEADNYYDVIKFNNEKNTALKITMNPLIGTMISKDLPIKGKKDDLYTISFWYKNEGIPNYADLIRNSVTIYFKPINGEAEYCVLSSMGFNTNENMWQYFSFRSRAVEDYESIRIIFSNGRQANNFYITNLAFYKELTSGDYQYDDNGNLISVTDQSENENVFEYNQENKLIGASSTVGTNLKYEYDKSNNNRIINTISSLGITNSLTYDDSGNTIDLKSSKKIINTEITSGIYKIRNKGTKQYIKAELNMALLEENECSNTLWKLEKVEEKFKICYSLHPSYSLSCNKGTISLDTSDTDNLFELEKNNDNSYRLKFIEETSDGSVIWFLKANENNLLEAKTYEENTNFDFYMETEEDIFTEQSAKYTEDGRYLTSIMDSNFNEVKYDVNNTTGLIEKMTSPNGLSVEYTYNEKKQLESIKCNEKEIKYQYNDNNLINKVIQDNKEYQIHYDNFLNPIKTTLNNDIIFTTNTYQPNNGKMLSTTYGNGDVITYDYDDFNRIKTISKDNDIYWYKYDNNGNLSKIISNNNEVRYYYDKSNRLYKYKCNELKAEFTYDSESDIISKAYKMKNNNHIQTNVYTNGMLASINDQDTIISYIYDKLNRKTEKNVNNLYNINYKYRSHGKRTNDIIDTYSINDNQYKYDYDKIGNICNVYYNNNIQKHYEYDIYGELISEKNYDLNTEVNYTYDAMGNMLTKSIKYLDTDTIRNYTYNYDNSKWEDQLTRFDGCNIEYDEIGNPIKIGLDTLIWKNGKELSVYTNNTLNTQVTYEYDLNGIRTSKTIGEQETKYHMIGNDIIYEEGDNRIIYYLYDNEGVIGLEYNGNRYYYIKNLQNDVIGIIDENGEQIVKYQYDSWGKILKIEDINGNSITNSSHIGIINPFRYRSYYYDTETGLYYLNSRYYNPEWGRFLSADYSIGINQDVFANNLYLYVSNNPINNIDINGQSIKSVIKWTKKAAKRLKKAAKNLMKQVSKIFNVKASTTKAESLDFINYVGRVASIDISEEVGVTSSYNVAGNENAPISVDLNVSNLLEASISVQFNTPIGSMAIGGGLGTKTIRFESPTDSYGERTVFEQGKNIYSMYTFYGTDTDIESGEVSFAYTRTTVSYLMVVLAVATYGTYGIKVASSEVVPQVLRWVSYAF